MEMADSVAMELRPFGVRAWIVNLTGTGSVSW